MKWKPCDLGKLFFDEKDYEGLIFWYDAVMQINKPQDKKK